MPVFDTALSRPKHQFSTLHHHMSRSTHSLFADTRGRSSSWIQAEAAQTLTHLLALYSLLNTESPICRLPPEILSLIFTFTAFSSSQISSWIHVAQVCRQWRDVALQCQTLWTYITPQHQESFISMCLERSGTSPLQLHYDFDHVRDCRASRDFSVMVQPHTSRFVDIDIVSPPAVMHSLLDRLDQPLCNLKRLSLGAKAPEGNRCLRPFTLSEDFASQIPSLNHLSLTYATLYSWTLPSFYGLRTLYLSEQHKSCAPTLDQFLRVLESCPDLEELVLRNAGPTLGRDATTYPEPSRVVELKHLRRVALLQDCFYDIPYVLAHLSIPETAQLDVQYLGNIYPPREVLTTFTHCLPRNSSALRPLKAVSYLRLSVQFGLIQVVGLSEISRGSTPALCVSTKRPHSQQTPEECIYDAFRQLPSTFAHCPLRHLAVSVPTHLVTTQDWLEIFSAFPLLERLTVEDCGSSVRGDQDKLQTGGRIFEALSTFSAGGRCPLPHLTSLCLRRWVDTEVMESTVKASMRSRMKDSTCATLLTLLVNCNEWTLNKSEAV